MKKWEPRGALDGGKDGLKYYREMFEQLRGANNELGLNIRKFVNSRTIRNSHPSQFAPLSIFCEICPEQAAPFKKMVRGYFPKAKCRVIKDLSGRNRVVEVFLGN
ncbi:MAG: hypothetical protein Q7S48_01305 [bacterium]|nr:hypothetical protein [bacterium]